MCSPSLYIRYSHLLLLPSLPPSLQPCPNCHRMGEAVNCVTDIPYFKEVLIMAFTCTECGYRNNEIKVRYAPSCLPSLPPSLPPSLAFVKVTLLFTLFLALLLSFLSRAAAPPFLSSPPSPPPSLSPVKVILISILFLPLPPPSLSFQGGGAIPPQGTLVRLRVESKDDFTRDVLKSDTAGISIPEIDLEITQVRPSSVPPFLPPSFLSNFLFNGSHSSLPPSLPPSPPSLRAPWVGSLPPWKVCWIKSDNT